jgi:hypothetical protein
VIHYLNLTRGALCADHVEQPRYLRLQSTWCEQKRWADVLWTLSTDFYVALASGQHLTVHDVSERSRQTRASWQGLSWVQFTCQRLWGGAPAPVLNRGGMDMSPYFTHELARLDRRVRRHVGYFRQFYTGQPLHIQLCPGRETPGIAASTAGSFLPRSEAIR